MARQRCKMCGQYEGFDGFDELGYCDDCRSDAVENFIKDITKPLYVWRMANGQMGIPYASDGMRVSADKRRKQAEREIIRTIASHA